MRMSRGEDGKRRMISGFQSLVTGRIFFRDGAHRRGRWFRREGEVFACGRESWRCRRTSQGGREWLSRQLGLETMSSERGVDKGETEHN